MFRAIEMLALTDCSDLMVVAADGQRFVGVLAEGDLLRAALPKIDDVLGAGGSLHDAFALFETRGAALANDPIGPLVIREPLTVGPSDHIGKAAVILVERYIRRLPVIHEGNLVGTISRPDIARGLAGVL
ncbi:MAG: CBS domain-containing protein [Solirubrobacteraceae bacterium]